MQELSYFQLKDMYLLPNDSEESYRRRKNEEKSVIAWGQRKLLLTLIQFLTLFWDPSKIQNPIVVYAGAAPGLNIGIVSQFFPEIEFHLYDPRSFKIKKSKKIHIYQKKFTNKTAYFWRTRQEKYKNVFFISDIRTADYTTINNLDSNEKQILKDMKFQMDWVKIIKPVKSHLKFRLPYTGGNRPDHVEYFDGFVLKQPYAPQTSTETRLVPHDDLKMKKWSCEKYQSQLFYHNSITREKIKYLNPFTKDNSLIDKPELTNDYDSNCETKIWIDYLTFRKSECTSQNVIALSRLITYKLTNSKKFKDSLHYLRLNPRAIKDRNIKPSRDDL